MFGGTNYEYVWLILKRGARFIIVKPTTVVGYKTRGFNKVWEKHTLAQYLARPGSIEEKSKTPVSKCRGA